LERPDRAALQVTVLYKVISGQLKKQPPRGMRTLRTAATMALAVAAVRALMRTLRKARAVSVATQTCDREDAGKGAFIF